MGDSKKRNKENKKENQSAQRKEATAKSKLGARKEQKTVSSNSLANGDLPDGKSYQVEEIMGCTEWQGQLVFLVKWVNEPDPQVVPAAIANVKYPQRVIEFYEKRIIWDQKE